MNERLNMIIVNSGPDTLLVLDCEPNTQGPTMLLAKARESRLAR